jgi:hypothetical protein
MNTECSATQLEFHGMGRHPVIGQFNGERLSSDGGGVLLREVEQRMQILSRLSRCFTNYHDPKRIEHGLETFIKSPLKLINNPAGCTAFDHHIDFPGHRLHAFSPLGVPLVETWYRFLDAIDV